MIVPVGDYTATVGYATGQLQVTVFPADGVTVTLSRLTVDGLNAPVATFVPDGGPFTAPASDATAFRLYVAPPGQMGPTAASAPFALADAVTAGTLPPLPDPVAQAVAAFMVSIDCGGPFTSTGA